MDVIMLNINHLLCALLFLFLHFHGSSTCGWHKGPWFNRPRRDVKASLFEYDKQSVDSFTAEDHNIKNAVNIKAALDRLRQVLSNNDEDKKSVDPKVIEYFSEQRDFWLRSPFSERNVSSTRNPAKRACSVIVNTEIPKPLLRNSNDEFILSHFLINIPDFQQTVEAYKCINVGNRCGVDYYVTQPKPNPGTCKQSLRYVKVLVLPVIKQYFDINDFRVAKFEVEDGCLCVKPQTVLY